MEKIEISQFMMSGVALFMAYIAYQQYWLNRNKLKLDLYEKRLRQFYVFKELLFEVSKKTIIEAPQLNEFDRVTNECIFLFEKDIILFKKEIFENVKELRRHERDISSLMNETNLQNTNIQKFQLERDSIVSWFDIQYSNIESKFHKYLYFKKI